jgi:adenosine kinase
MPIYEEIWANPKKDCVTGGAALNSARCAAFSRNLLGMAEGVDYFGGVGNDDRGAQLEKIALESKVAVNFDKSSSEPTGTCAVLVQGSDRSLCANIAAAGKYDIAHLQANMATLEQAKYLYTTGFFITSNFDALMMMAKHCNDNNKPMVFNFSAPFLCQFFNEQVEKALECADYVFCNEDEAAAFGTGHGLEGQPL